MHIAPAQTADPGIACGRERHRVGLMVGHLNRSGIRRDFDAGHRVGRIIHLHDGKLVGIAGDEYPGVVRGDGESMGSGADADHRPLLECLRIENGEPGIDLPL